MTLLKIFTIQLKILQKPIKNRTKINKNCLIVNTCKMLKKLQNILHFIFKIKILK